MIKFCMKNGMRVVALLLVIVLACGVVLPQVLSAGIEVVYIDDDTWDDELVIVDLYPPDNEYIAPGFPDGDFSNPDLGLGDGSHDSGYIAPDWPQPEPLPPDAVLDIDWSFEEADCCFCELCDCMSGSPYLCAQVCMEGSCAECPCTYINEHLKIVGKLSTGGIVPVGYDYVPTYDVVGDIIVYGMLFVTEEIMIEGTVYVRPGGHLVITNGVIYGMVEIQGLCRRLASFDMYGGVITGGDNRAVDVQGANARFRMVGGYLQGNSVNQILEELPVGMGGSTVLVRDGGVFDMSGGFIQDNRGFGGTVRVQGEGSTFNMSNSAVIRRNDAHENAPNVAAMGGAINGVGTGVSINITGGQIYGNSALINGGAIAVRGASLHVSNVTIADNMTVFGDGGGIYIAQSGASSIIEADTIITGNRSGGHGGGIWMGFGVTIDMYGGQVYGNSARFGMGGVHVSGGQFNLYGGYIYDNINSTSDNDLACENSTDTFCWYDFDNNAVRDNNYMYSDVEYVLLCNGAGAAYVLAPDSDIEIDYSNVDAVIMPVFTPQLPNGLLQSHALELDAGYDNSTECIECVAPQHVRGSVSRSRAN